MDWGAWRLQSMGSQRVGHDWATNTFTTQGLVLWKTIFPHMEVREGWFWNYSSTFHLLCMLFLWLLHQLFRISLGIRSRRLGTPDLHDEIPSCFWDRQGPSWCRPRLLGHVHLWPFPPPPPSPGVWSSWWSQGPWLSLPLFLALCQPLHLEYGLLVKFYPSFKCQLKCFLLCEALFVFPCYPKCPLSGCGSWTLNIHFPNPACLQQLFHCVWFQCPMDCLFLY